MPHDGVLGQGSPVVQIHGQESVLGDAQVEAMDVLDQQPKLPEHQRAMQHTAEVWGWVG